MKRRTMILAFAVLSTASLSSGQSVCDGAMGRSAICSARELDRAGDRELDGKAARRNHVLAMRVAAADRLIEAEDEIRAYIEADFNTVVLYDTENGLLKSEERIAFETAFARTHRLRIILGKATEPLTSAMTARLTPTAAHRRTTSWAAAASASVSDEEIRERLRLWDRHGSDLIVGVFFLHDDAFWIRATAQRQRHLYQLAQETVPDWDVFGMIGEFGFAATAEEVDRYFDPAAFDHLIMLMYPLNLGDVTGMPLDTIASSDPDADMKLYVSRYLTRMGERFVQRLRPGQVTILVVQAFAYHGDAAGRVPRPADVAIQASLGTELLRRMPGQERNRSIAYFLWDGSRAGMSGLWQRQDWAGAARAAHRPKGRRRQMAQSDSMPLWSARTAGDAPAGR